MARRQRTIIIKLLEARHSLVKIHAVKNILPQIRLDEHATLADLIIYRELCRERFRDMNYTPCAFCRQFDSCGICSHYVECADLVTKFLPNMFRRLVREIRLGEDTARTQQMIRRNTLNGRKKD